MIYWTKYHISHEYFINVHPYLWWKIVFLRKKKCPFDWKKKYKKTICCQIYQTQTKKHLARKRIFWQREWLVWSISLVPFPTGWDSQLYIYTPVHYHLFKFHSPWHLLHKRYNLPGWEIHMYHNFQQPRGSAKKKKKIQNYTENFFLASSCISNFKSVSRTVIDIKKNVCSNFGLLKSFWNTYWNYWSLYIW